MNRFLALTMIAIAWSAVTSSNRIVTVPVTCSLTTMLILDWRASRRSTCPTSSPWNSRTPTPPFSVTFSGSTVVVVPTGDDVVDVVVVVCVTVAAGVAALAEVWANRTGEFSFAFAAGLAAWFGAAGLTAGAGAGELVWACEKDNAATKA